MRIFTGIRRRLQRASAPAPGSVPVTVVSQLDTLADSIAHSQARLLMIADRVAAGRAQPGDESRLRIQREMTASFQKRLEKVALPTGTGDDAEAWLRSITDPSGLDTRQKDSH
ncbi:hypothetical protein [Arthrobacter sedimenti]|uniref:hypothetical protein n=1 Tax=Arthrobacter sedimenti TaxID=2694931 RepID=UPI000B357358|nr:hypothetical protein [Arthrobacter sedimenti]OUM43317.1 hypothetical protein B8W73_05205 [Arthrobacter agilis]